MAPELLPPPPPDVHHLWHPLVPNPAGAHDANSVQCVALPYIICVMRIPVTCGLCCSLDELLHGGFLTGTVLEVCGLSGEGKTQLCLSVSAHVAASLMQVVHYLDTKGDFSASRVSDIIKNKEINEEVSMSFLSPRLLAHDCRTAPY